MSNNICMECDHYVLSRHWNGRVPITPLFSWCCKIYVPCNTSGLARQAALLRRDIGGVLPFLEPRGTDSESYCISSSHSGLIRCLTITELANMSPQDRLSPDMHK